MATSAACVDHSISVYSRGLCTLSGRKGFRYVFPTEGSFPFALLFFLSSPIDVAIMSPTPLTMDAVIDITINSLIQHTWTRRGCLEVDLAPLQNGFVQIRYRGSKYYCHVVAAAYKTRRIPRPGEQATQICDNHKCVHPGHLTIEWTAVAKTRAYCRYFYMDHRHICLHTPCCIIRDEVRERES